MRIEKKTLNDALRVLGKVVCQTSPVELYRSVRFVGDENGVLAMVTDGVETVSVAMEAFAETAPFAHTAENKNTIDAMGDVAFKDFFQSRFIQRTVFKQRSDCGTDNKFFHDIKFSIVSYLEKS